VLLKTCAARDDICLSVQRFFGDRTANRPASSAGDRYWELSGGLLRCGGCGLVMQTHTVKSPHHDRIYRYYRCPCHQSTRRGTCSAPVNVPAQRAEEAVWRFVTELETEPGRILEWLERKIEAERRLLETDPEKELRKLWSAMDATVVQRSRYQDQQAHGLMTIEELRGRLEDLAEERTRLERELEACANRGDELRNLEEMRDLYAEAIKPGKRGWLMRNALADGQTVLRMKMLKGTEGPLRRRRYEALRLEIKAVARDELELRGIFGSEIFHISKMSSLQPSTPITPRPPSRA
jgi:hypothetical protein